MQEGQDMIKFYYKLTQFIPRPLPSNEQEYQELKQILVACFNLPDEPQTWATVAAQIQGTKVGGMRKSYGHIANVVRRLSINALAETHKRQAFKENNERIQKAMQSLETKPEVQDLPGVESAMVPLSH